MSEQRTPRTLRASAVPRAIICPPSERAGLRIDSDGEEARLGSALHAAMAHLVTTGTLPEIGTLAQDYSLPDTDDLGPLAFYGVKVWHELEQWFPNPVTEQYLETPALNDQGDKLAGHVDLSAIQNGELRILDWKTGRKQHDFIHQLRAYALLMLGSSARNTPIESIACTTVWLRDAFHDTRRFSVAEVLALKDELRHVLEHVDSDQYRTGAHCEFCPRLHDCPARSALVQRAITDVGRGITAESIVALGERLPDVRAGVRCLKAACEQFDSSLKEAVASAPNGELAVNGTILFFNTIHKRQIDPLRAWPVLTERLTAEEMAPALKVSVTALEQAVSDKAGRGQKGVAKKELGEALEAAGAISLKEEKRLAERPAK